MDCPENQVPCLHGVIHCHLCAGAQSPNLLSGLITGMSEQSLPIPTWSWDTYNLPFYYTALVLLLLALGVSWYIRYSKYGLSLLAIRDDEDRAQGLGVKVGPYKLGVYVISAIFVGMAGAMNVYFLGFISPTSAFDRSFNIAIPLMAFLGGLGTVAKTRNYPNITHYAARAFLVETLKEQKALS
jgi:ABC-type branched-subunit amino acid transport system permease subunit